jgi:hypothetical protein
LPSVVSISRWYFGMARLSPLSKPPAALNSTVRSTPAMFSIQLDTVMKAARKTVEIRIKSARRARTPDGARRRHHAD